jgi:hypothetical protein
MEEQYQDERGGSNLDLETLNRLKREYELDSIEASYPSMALIGAKTTRISKYAYIFYNVPPQACGRFLFCDLYQQLNAFESRQLITIVLVRTPDRQVYDLRFINEIIKFMVDAPPIGNIVTYLNDLVELMDTISGPVSPPAPKNKTPRSIKPGG